MMLKSVLDSLKPEDKARLMHAFDHYFSQFVVLDNKHYIGVNLNNDNFVVEESIGVWSYGSIRNGN